MYAASNDEEGLAARSGHKCHNNITVFPKFLLPIGMTYLQIEK